MNAYHPKRVKRGGQDRVTIGVMARTAEDDHDADRPRRGVPEVRRAGPAGSTTLDVQALYDVLGTSFALSVHKPHAVRRTTLETFDRRLQRAGERLQLVAEAGEERLELAGQQGKSVLRLPARNGSRWPAMACTLPDSALKDHVARISGIRALLIVDEHRRRVQRSELCNADGKIVVRLDVDEPADGAAAPPPEVTVRPLRGYRKAADRAWQLILTMLEPVADERIASPAAGPAMVVDPESPARVLLAAELTDFLRDIRDNLPGTIADIDTEFLHDVRVAVRRTRSLLKLGRPALPAHLREVWEPQFKWLGDLTTPVRDLDVYQLGLPEMAGWLAAAAPTDLDPFKIYLAHRRDAERRALVQGLRGARLRRLIDGWAAELTALADAAQATDCGGWSAGALARTSLARAHRLLVRGGTAISDSSPPEALHVLRKRCKELRYALEMFAPVLDDRQDAKAIKDLKALQDVLGRFQDSEVQRISLRGFAQEMIADGVPADALLAMGELMSHLHAEQQRAHAEFAPTFAAYIRPATRERMARLVDPGGKAVA